MATQSSASPSPYERGRLFWPGVRLAEAVFARRVAELGVRPEDLAARPGDLYLAWACAERDASALAHFDRTFLPLVPRYVRCLNLNDDKLDEVRQELRIRLLVGETPRIGQYSGCGPLGAWVRTSAIRVGLRFAAPTKSQSADLDALGALMGDGVNPELLAIRKRYGGTFQRALERSFHALDARDKTLLRLSFVDSLGIDAIGRIYRVHRATAARWLVLIRRQVLVNLQRECSIELTTTGSEWQSMLRIMKQDLELNLQHVLREVDGSGGSRSRRLPSEQS